jgi:hypothetical protein
LNADSSRRQCIFCHSRFIQAAWKKLEVDERLVKFPWRTGYSNHI